MITPYPFVAVDWGTTNRRLFVLDAQGNCLLEETDSLGVASIGRAAIGPAIADLKARFAGHRLILAGMIGSSLGWHDVAYVPCPAGLGCLVGGAITPEQDFVFLIPGVRSAPDETPDVMRGEEVQIIGAAEANLIPPDCAVCHPGTHAKWALVRGYAIQSFRTVMTGELFALLRSRSILSGALTAPVVPGAAFERGVDAGLSSRSLCADLFSIRARTLLDLLSLDEAASWASGLLIGSDVRFGLEVVGGDEPVAVIGDPLLTRLYAAALRAAGRAYFEIDGGDAFIAGSNAIARRLPCPA